MKFGSTAINSVKVGTTAINKLMLGTAEVWASGPEILVSDNFERTDAAALGTAPTGQTWTVNIGGFSITSGKAHPTTSTNSRVYIDAEASDVSASVTIDNLASETWLIFRCQTDGVGNNMWRAGGSGGTKYARLQSFVESAPTVSLVNTDVVLESGDLIEVVCVGDSITMFVNDVEVLTTTNSFNQSSTTFGLQATNVDDRFDDFVIEAVASGGGGDALAGFMFTEAEFATWQDRWANGPYLVAGDVSTNTPSEPARITARKNAFLADPTPWLPTGPASGAYQWDEEVGQRPDADESVDMLHAAFYAALHSDTTARDAWKTAFDTVWSESNLDFSNRTLFPYYPSVDTDIPDEGWFAWMQHVLRLLSGYDYISHVWPNTWTANQRDDIEGWFLSLADLCATSVDNNLTSRWSDRGDLTSATTSVTGTGEAAARLSDGSTVTNLAISQFYNNRRMFSMFGAGIIALRFGDSAIRTKAEAFYQECLALLAADGVLNENHRGHVGLPSLGLGYLAHSLGVMGTFGEYHRRVTGSATLLDMSVSLEVDKANPGSMKASTARTLLTLMQMYVEQMDGTTDLYSGDAPSITEQYHMDGWHDTSEGGSVDWKTILYVGFAVANSYYQDAYLDGLIYQTGAGMPGYPSFPAGDGNISHGWGGPSQIIPSMPLQYMTPPA